jgi:hypothetical protein
MIRKEDADILTVILVKNKRKLRIGRECCSH